MSRVCRRDRNRAEGEAQQRMRKPVRWHPCHHMRCEDRKVGAELGGQRDEGSKVSRQEVGAARGINNQDDSQVDAGHDDMPTDIREDEEEADGDRTKDVADDGVMAVSGRDRDAPTMAQEQASAPDREPHVCGIQLDEQQKLQYNVRAGRQGCG